MTDPNGYWPRWLSNAAAAVHNYVASVYNQVVNVVVETKAYVSKKVTEVKVAGNKIITGVLNTAVGFSNSQKGQTISAYADSMIGKKIVSAAEANVANAWHARPLGTLAISKLPKESELLAFGKKLTNKGIGVTAMVSLGLSAWDDFHNHGLRSGGGRFGVDLLNAGLNIGIGIVAATVIGPELGLITGLGLSIVLGDKIFTPLKESIK